MSISREQFLKEFGRKIAEARKKTGMSQEQLAAAVDLHRTYIGFIEQGKRNPSLWNIQKIADALKISIKDLF